MRASSPSIVSSSATSSERAAGRRIDTQLSIAGLPGSFPPLRAEQEEPIDFGERLNRRIRQDVERQIEQALASPGGTKTSRLAFAGLLNLVLLVAAAVAIILLLRLVF